MKSKLLGQLCCLFLLARGTAEPLYAADLTLSAGADYSTGDYGDQLSTDTWFFPFSLKWETERWTSKLTVPYIRTSGPGDVVGVGPDRVAVEGASNTRRSESGLGDVTGSLGYSLIERAGWLVELIGKVKAPTADENKGLGTGETDYATQLDIAKQTAKTTWFGTIGKKLYGDPEGSDFNDPVYLSLGVSQKVKDSLSVGLAYDWRRQVTDSGEDMREATLFLSQRFDKAWKGQLYLVKGFSTVDPDWGMGVVLSYRY